MYLACIISEIDVLAIEGMTYHKAALFAEKFLVILQVAKLVRSKPSSRPRSKAAEMSCRDGSRVSALTVGNENAGNCGQADQQTGQNDGVRNQIKIV